MLKNVLAYMYDENGNCMKCMLGKKVTVLTAGNVKITGVLEEICKDYITLTRKNAIPRRIARRDIRHIEYSGGEKTYDANHN